MPSTVYIFGSHSLRDNLVRQYKEAGAEVSVMEDFRHEGLQDGTAREIVILPMEGKGDGRSEDFLREIAGALRGKSPQRPLVHMLLKDASSLRRYELSDFPPEVNETLEVYPFSLEEAWADTLLRRGLDRSVITAESKQFVHLVIDGFDGYAQNLALYAAQTAHYPNYNGKEPHPLRTRITVAGAESRERDRFIARYHQLFDHSFYRFIDPEERRSTLHHPQYEGKREDFVDIEWEFVNAELSHPVLVEKLAFWTKDPLRQLTLAISHPEDTVNIDTALALPDSILESDTPVWVRLHEDNLSGSIGQNPRYRNLVPFGMDSEGYDARLPAIRMARLLHFFYTCGESIPTVFLADEVDEAWRQVETLKNRLSNIWNARCIPTKMRSAGYSCDDEAAFYALSKEELEPLAHVEHNRWCVERLLSGTRVCTDEERDAIDRDISLKAVYKKERDAHYDLCAYDELGTDAKGIDVRVYDRNLTACIPLMVKSLKEEDGR